MKTHITLVALVVALLGIICSCHSSSKPINIKHKELTLVYLCVNEANTKARLSFCLEDKEEEAVWVKVEQADNGVASVTLQRPGDSPEVMTHDGFQLVRRAPLPGLTQGGIDKTTPPFIYGFTVEFAINSPRVKQVMVGDEKIKLDHHRTGYIRKAAGKYPWTLSSPVRF